MKIHRPNHQSDAGCKRGPAKAGSDTAPESRRLSLGIEDGKIPSEDRSYDTGSSLFTNGYASFQQSTAEDDVRIALLERKLGKRRRKAGSLESLLGELDELGGCVTSDEDAEKFRVKHSSDPVSEKWLSKKRLKVSEDASDCDQKSTAPGRGSYEGIEISDEKTESHNKQRENPYKAPCDIASIRSSPKANTLTSGIRDLYPLRRQMQGLFNRLSETNILDIIRSVDKMYRENARNDVSSVIIDLMMTHLTGQGSLNDAFIILHSGFAAALYKVVGTDLGARLVQALVNDLQKCQKEDDLVKGKDKSNIVSFLAELFSFQVIGSKLIYDLIRQFIENLSELSVELLLKIIRSSGQQLRQDDPSSLTDTVTLLHNAVRRIGESNMSIRARFMVETITDLKNGRVRTGQHTAALRTQNANFLKRTLASMSSAKNLTIKAVEPLYIGLDDIRNSQLRGKWWLVGASFKGEVLSEHKNDSSSLLSNKDRHYSDLSQTSDTTDERQWAVTDVSAAAKSLGLNTDVRKAIFAAIMTAAGVDAAHTSITKLRLNRRQEAEIAVVLTRCSASEHQYNSFYHVLAQKLSLQREIRKTLWNPLIEIITVLEDEESISEDRVAHHEWCHDAQARFNISKFYSFLIAENVVTLSVLKNRDILGAGDKLTSFYELLLVNLLSTLGKDGKKISRCFETLRNSEVASQMEIFLEKRVRQSAFADQKRIQSIKQGCKKAINVIRTPRV